jgi:hypothetical protein
MGIDRGGAVDGVDNLTVTLQFGHYPYVVEAALQGFFDRVDPDWRIRRLGERLEARAFLGFMRTWLPAGIVDTTGALLPPATGTPQGGVVSPVLANVSLHYALELGFEKVLKPRCRGEACLLRDAEDDRCAFAYPEEAARCSAAWGPRLEKFGLTLAPEPTRRLPFSRPPSPGLTSCEFLGFEVRWGQDRAGKAHLKRRPARPKLRASLPRFPQGCRENRHRRLRVRVKQLNGKLRGDSHSSGVHGNSARLKQFFDGARRILLKWLNRRRPRRSSSWQGVTARVEPFKVERPRLVGHPKTRSATALA